MSKASSLILFAFSFLVAGCPPGSETGGGGSSTAGGEISQSCMGDFGVSAMAAKTESFLLASAKFVRAAGEIQTSLQTNCAAMGREDILISDVGAHKIWVARQYPTYEAGTCFITNGFCSMGFALPSAIAAKRLHPEKNVVALCGALLWAVSGCAIERFSIVTAEYRAADKPTSDIQPADDKQTPDEILDEVIRGH